MRVRLGVDVGGTKIRVVAINDRQEICSAVTRPSGRGTSWVLESILNAIWQTASSLTGLEIASVGVGIPGNVDSTTGIIRHAVNLNIEAFDLAGSLSARLGVPATIDNDVNAAALGARELFGVTTTMAYLNLGTGVAAGIIGSDGLLRGSKGFAGEIGHISINPNGPKCDCGRHGCIEAYAGGRYVDGASLFRSDRVVDDRVRMDRETVGWAVSSAILALILTNDPEQVIIGGGMTRAGDLLLTAILEALQRETKDSAFVGALRGRDRVQMLPPNTDAAAIGAALLGPEKI